MVRDQKFVSNLAEFAKQHDIVIELSGGILSHAYYMLSRAGCEVECADLDDFVRDNEAIEYNKLVRDFIPQTIASRGENVSLMRLRGEALIEALRRKLVEEALEVLDATTSDQIAEEVADVREVLLSIMAELKISEAQVEATRREKLRKRGGFGQAIMLTRTAVSSPLAADNTDELLMPLKSNLVVEKELTRSIELPSTVVDEIHLDQRHDADGATERQLTTSVPMHGAGFAAPQLAFNLPTQDGYPHALVVELHLERQASNLRIRIRMINESKQLELTLDGSQSSSD